MSQPSLSERFESTFRKPLGHFMDPTFGFDAVRFDERLIRPPDGVSCEQEVRRRFGQPAVDLVRELINARRPHDCFKGAEA